jgi:shikimate kinase
MFKSQNIFLIGPMGAGKTTIGRFLAKELQYVFYDADKEIEVHAGADINWIFDVEGEDKFRKREEHVIADLSALSNIVLATGGGCVLSPRNRLCLTGRGVVVYLQVSIEHQLLRLEHSRDRPLFHKAANPKTALEQLAALREPLYLEMADIVIPTDDLQPHAIAQQILNKLEQPPMLNDDEKVGE